MQMSETVEALATALAAAQSELEPAAKDSVNPAFRSKYADLTSIVEACRPVLAKHGLSFVQVFEESDPGTLRLTTVLLHTSGQWLSGTCSMPVSKPDPQAYGSAATYARRYGLSALVGMVADEDDDGNAASQARKDSPRPSREEMAKVNAAAAAAPVQVSAPKAIPSAPSVPESSGDRQAAGDPIEQARKAFFAAFSEHFGRREDVERHAVVGVLLGKQHPVALTGATLRQWEWVVEKTKGHAAGCEGGDRCDVLLAARELAESLKAER